MIAAVDEVLHEIGAHNREHLLVLNKIDLLDDDGRRGLQFRHPRAAQVSAATGEGLDDLREAIEARFLSTLQPMELLVPYEEGGSLSELHELAGRGRAQRHRRGRARKARVPAGSGGALRALRRERPQRPRLAVVAVAVENAALLS